LKEGKFRSADSPTIKLFDCNIKCSSLGGEPQTNLIEDKEKKKIRKKKIKRNVEGLFEEQYVGQKNIKNLLQQDLDLAWRELVWRGGRYCVGCGCAVTNGTLKKDWWCICTTQVSNINSKANKSIAKLWRNSIYKT
jgi:hypothetical protein